MNYYEVNVTYLEGAKEFTTSQCIPMSGNPIMAQMNFKRLTKKYTEEAISPLGGKLKSVKTKRITRRHYEANKQLKVYEGGN